MELTKTNKKFRTFVTNLKSTTGLGTGLLFFGSALNLPIERIGRIQILLTELIQYSQLLKTDYGLLCQAYQQIAGVSAYINKVRILEPARYHDLTTATNLTSMSGSQLRFESQPSAQPATSSSLVSTGNSL
jgi:hypothetical protein